MGIVEIDLNDNVPDFLRRWHDERGWDDMAEYYAEQYNVSEEDIQLAAGKEYMRKKKLNRVLDDKGVSITTGKYMNITF